MYLIIKIEKYSRAEPWFAPLRKEDAPQTTNLRSVFFNN